MRAVTAALMSTREAWPTSRSQARTSCQQGRIRELLAQGMRSDCCFLHLPHLYTGTPMPWYPGSAAARQPASSGAKLISRSASSDPAPWICCRYASLGKPDRAPRPLETFTMRPPACTHANHADRYLSSNTRDAALLIKVSTALPEFFTSRCGQILQIAAVTLAPTHENTSSMPAHHQQALAGSVPPGIWRRCS
jgi:hypothetical protein